MKIIQYAVIGLFVLFPFAQLTRIPLFFSPAIRLYAQDVLVAVIAVTLTVQWLRNKNSIKAPPLTNYIALFLLAALISLIINANRYSLNELAVSSLYLVRWVVYAAIYIAVYNLLRLHKFQAFKTEKYLLIAGTVSALFGLIQYFVYPNLRNLIYLGWDPHEYRIFGTFFDSGYLGLIYVLTLILASSNFTTGTIIIWIVVYAAFALTYSRSSYLALILSAFVYSCMSKSMKPFLISLALVVPLFFMLPHPSPTAEGTDLTRTTSAVARLTNIEKSITIIKDNPLFGIGFNTLRYENRDRTYVPAYEWENNNAAAGFDNSFLFIWATTGIIGLAFYSSILIRSMYTAYEKVKRGNAVRADYLILISLTAIVIHSQFNNSLFYPWIMVWMWILLAESHVKRLS